MMDEIANPESKDTFTVRYETTGEDISRGRRISIVTYTDDAVMITIHGHGQSVTHHFDKADMLVIMTALTNGIEKGIGCDSNA